MTGEKEHAEIYNRTNKEEAVNKWLNPIYRGRALLQDPTAQRLTKLI